jgi:hypothetical protein
MRTGAAGRALLDAALVRLALAKQFTPVAELVAAAGGRAALPPADQKKTSAPPAVAAEPARETPADDVWQKIVRGVQERRPSVAPLLDGGRLGKVEADSVEILLPADRANLAAMLDRNGKREVVEEAAGHALGRSQPTRVTFATGDHQAPTLPGARHAPPTDLDFSADPLIQAAIEQMDARVVKVEDID